MTNKVLTHICLSLNQKLPGNVSMKILDEQGNIKLSEPPALSQIKKSSLSRRPLKPEVREDFNEVK